MSPPSRPLLLAALALIAGMSLTAGAVHAQAADGAGVQPALAQNSVAPAPVVAPPAQVIAVDQAPPTTPAAAAALQTTAAPTLDAVQKTVAQLQSQARTTTSDSRLAVLRAQSATAQAAAESLAAAKSRDLASLDAQLDRAAAARQTAEERRRRAELLARRAQLAGELRQAQAASESAGATYDLVAQRRRDAFTARVFRQSASPLSPEFWSSLAEEIAPDIGRLGATAQEAVRVAIRAPEPRAGLLVAGAVVLAALLLVPFRRFLEQLGRSGVGGQGVHARFARSARALWVAIVDTVTPAVAANILHLGAQWGGLLSSRADALARSAIAAVTWGAAILALGRATLAGRKAADRLAPAPDQAANRIRSWLWIVALITSAGFLLTRLDAIIGASVSATVATNCALSIAYSAVAGFILVSFGRGRRALEEALEGADAPPARPAQAQGSAAWTLVSLTLATAIAATLGAVLAGYTNLAVLISFQVFWWSVLAAATWLLMRFVDDLCETLFQRGGWAARTLLTVFRFRRSTIGQIGVLLSAALRLLILFAVLNLALARFGQSGSALLGHLRGLGRTIHVGSATLSPRALGAAVVSVVVGMGIVHFVHRWVERRYLPVTDWDAGVRNSVSTGIRYFGVGVTLLCALAVMGLGLKQLALVAGALSVGIGFGLQQVVQNFVSGVILLIERPVKVGDWVNIGGQEGDIRSIRVRATEIQTFDRTTLIVPNSDLITKIVQNKTLGDPRGRVQLQLSIANPGDARKASDLILQAAKARAEVLRDPPPVVYIDSLTNGGSVNFNAFLYVATPRDAYKVKSALFFDILDLFQKNDIPFMGAAGPQDVVVEPGPTLEKLLGAVPKPAPPPQPKKP